MKCSNFIPVSFGSGSLLVGVYVGDLLVLLLYEEEEGAFVVVEESSSSFAFFVFAFSAIFGDVSDKLPPADAAGKVVNSSIAARTRGERRIICILGAL